MPFDYTLFVPPHVRAQPNISSGPSAQSHRRLPTAVDTIARAASSSCSGDYSIRAKASSFFGNWTLCQKISERWRQFCDSISYCFTRIKESVFGLSPRPPEPVTSASPPSSPYPQINTDMSREALRRIYWGLGRDNKWRECIDGRYHHLNTKYVFDRGLHAGTVEPGYIASMEESFTWIEHWLNYRVDADWYLRLQKHTCAHFNGDPAIYLMGQEKVGVFRNGPDDAVCCALAPPYYEMSAEARAEHEILNQEVMREFGAAYRFGDLNYDAGNRSTRLTYKGLAAVQIRQIFNKYLNEYYQKVGQAATPDQKLWAIADLQQRLEWLHPLKDGTARTSTALMNKNLVECGFHPAILEYPHRSSSYTRAQWKQYLQNGLLKWEQQKAILNP